MSATVKRSSLFQEGLRRANSFSQGVSRDEYFMVRSEFSNMLRLSGYDIKYRFQLIKGVLDRLKQMDELILKGDIVKFRS